MEPLEKALAGACSGKADGLVKIFEPGDLHRLTSRQIGGVIEAARQANILCWNFQKTLICQPTSDRWDIVSHLRTQQSVFLMAKTGPKGSDT